MYKIYEFISKVKEVKSSDEIIEIAEQNGIILYKSKIEKVYEQFHKKEIKDKNLDNIADGTLLVDRANKYNI